MRKVWSFWKLVLSALLLATIVSCSGLREHIKQRQLETHGPPKDVKDYRNNDKSHDNLGENSSDNRGDLSSRNNATVEYSKKWGVTLPDNADVAFLKEIDTWLGTPYVYGGESKSGTDCSGMIQTIYKTVYGISLQRSANGMQQDVDFIPLQKAELGDIVFFKINFETVGHVALYLGDRKFIHATVNKGVMISSLDELYYSKRYYKVGKIIAMEKR